MTLATAEIDIPWLAAAVAASGIDVVSHQRDTIDVAGLESIDPDWVVIDSYLVPAESVTMLSEAIPVLLLADGDSRGARATLYLDQNLSAQPLPGVTRDAQLLGVEYALVRRSIREAAAPESAIVRHDPPEVVVVLGGTDPDDRTVDVARGCRSLADRVAFTFVAPVRQHRALAKIGGESRQWRVLPPTHELPALLAQADVTVSAGGTSAWDVATIGTPSVLLAVVPNQQASVAAAASMRIALGFDAVSDALRADEIGVAVAALIDDDVLRRQLVSTCRRLFDGRGGERVVAALEQRRRQGRRGADA
ncbi:hypothetical protein [Microbacterium sp. NPDC055357]